MASIFITSLLLVLLWGALPLFAQGLDCPEGSSLTKDTVLFTVSTTQQKLLPLLGDFYSPSWQTMFFRVNITTSPPHRTLHYSPIELTETLISGPDLSKPLDNGFDLSWELTSGPFTPLRFSDKCRVAYYKQKIEVRPVCPGSTYSSVAWSTSACITGDGANRTAGWFAAQHRIVAGNIFEQVARGWFGGINDDPEGNNCNHFDTRVSALPTTPMTSSPPISKPSAVVDNAPQADDELVPTITETYKVSYAGILGLGTTLSWPAGGAPTATVGPVTNTSSTSIAAVESYNPTAGAMRSALSKVFGLALGGFVVLIV
ncbi:hypothetical protein Q9L58_008971 [Maublancomyces gigas]|uniref:Uncharacterized protein n=1 Tax=Discina gigas TaxID=1032678 RepID=A0ABR3G863_9PEZI